MKKTTMVELTDLSLITCIVERGLADSMVDAAMKSGAQGATISYAKGRGIREKLGVWGVTIDIEKEMISILVSNQNCDHIIKELYQAGHLDQAGKGIIYSQKLDKAATYLPPELLKATQ